MRIVSFVLFGLYLIAFPQNVQSQSIGIGTDNPSPNAIFELLSTEKGMLIPRLTTAQRDANLTTFSAGDTGLLIFNTTDNEFNYWDGSAWIGFPSAGGGNDSDWDNIGALLTPSDGIAEDVAIGTATATGKLTVEDVANDVQPGISVSRSSSTSNTYGVEIESSVSNGGGAIYNDLNNAVSNTTELNAVHNDFTGLSNFNINNTTRAIYNNFNMNAAVAVSGMENNFDGTNNQLKHGVWNRFSAASQGTQYGMRSDFATLTGVFAERFGVANYFTSTTFGTQYGLFNEFSGSANAAKYAIKNDFLTTAAGESYGIQNNFSSTDNSAMYGLENRYDAPGTGEKVGVRNVFLTASGANYGMTSIFYGTTNYGKIGTATTFNNNAGGRHTGHSVIMNGTNSEFKQAYVANFGGNTGGTMVGMDVDFNASGSDPKYGVRVVMGSVTPGINHAFDVNMGTKPQDYAAYFIGKQYISYRLGVGVQLPNYMLEVGTNAAAKPTSSAWTVTSDERLKKNIKPFTDGLNVIKKINPVWFTYNGLANMPDETGVGTIAQELQKVAPYMVGTWEYMDSVDFSTKEYLNADYGSLDFVLVNAVQEQQVMIEKLKAKNEDFEEIVRELLSRIEMLEKEMEQQ